jgi:hypothetical protein
MMQLSRDVPKHTRTERFTWVKTDFMLFGTFKAARKRMSLKEYTACYWCRAPFSDDHMLALAQPEKGKNRLLCQDCAKLLQSSSQGE